MTAQRRLDGFTPATLAVTEARAWRRLGAAVSDLRERVGLGDITRTLRTLKTAQGDVEHQRALDQWNTIREALEGDLRIISTEIALVINARKLLDRVPDDALIHKPYNWAETERHTHE